jgi:hypothetical protein
MMADNATVIRDSAISATNFFDVTEMKQFQMTVVDA